jgi:hypothetical protein
MARQKNFLLLAIIVGIAGVVIGGISIFLSITNIAKP